MSATGKKCVPCQKGTPAMEFREAEERARKLSGWSITSDGKWLEKSYKFKNFLQALAFVNRIADIAERENHHPDITLGWGYANIRLQTHTAGGLHENDFIVAAEIEAIQ